jgi:ATP-dependent Clp protease ATP-binding subunit ClpA
VPLNRMEQKEAQKLLKMEEELKQQVIGQDEAVIAISKALRRSRADLKDPRAQSGHSYFWVQPASEKRFWHVLWRSSCLATPTL